MQHSVNINEVLDHQQNSIQDFSIIDSNSIGKRQCTVSELAVKAISLAYGINRESFAFKDSSINGALLADTHW